MVASGKKKKVTITLDSSTDDSKTRLTTEDSFKDVKDFENISFWQMLRYANWVDYVLLFCGIFFSILDGVCTPLSSIIFKGITDVLMEAEHNRALSEQGNSNVAMDYDKFSQGVMYYSFLYFLQALNLFTLTMIAMVCFYTLSERQAYKIKQHFFEAILKQDMEWFDKKEVGALTQIMTNGIDKIRHGTSDKMVQIMKSTANLVAGIGVAAYLNIDLTLVMILMAPALSLSIYISNRTLMKQTKKEMAAYSLAGALAEEVLSSIRTVMAFNAQYFELNRYEDCLLKARKVGYCKAFIVSACNGFYIFIEFLAMGIGFWYGATLVFYGDITPGTVFGVFWSVFLGAMRFGMCVPQLSTLVNAKMAASEIFDIIDCHPTLIRGIGKKPKEIYGHVEFSDVTFSYPSRKSIKVLNGISFSVPAGQNIALVGHSGCGKSTTIGLLMRYYQQSGGKVTIDGIRVEDYDVEWLRSVIGIVSQEPVVFHSTIAENLKMGRCDVTQREMEEACRDANAHEFIERLPQGYETLLGEGGVKLSGGQKQRLAIARALIRKPKILLLDEATSALDTESERLVQAALDKATTGRTTITIAHRLSTVKNADKIIVFDKGNIVESGTHEELLAVEDGFYRKLVTSQEIETMFDEEKLHSSEKLTSPQRRSSSTKQESSTTMSMRSLIMEDDEADNASEIKELLKKEGAKPASTWQIIKYAKPELGYGIFGFMLSLIRGSSWPLFSVVYGILFRLFAATSYEKPVEGISTSLGPDNESNTKLLWITAAFVGIGILGGITSWLSGYVLGYIGEKINVRLRMDVYTNLMRQDGSYFDNKNHSVGKLTSRLATDSSNVQAAIDQRLADVLQGLTSLIAGLGIAMYFSYSFAPCCLFTSLVFIIIQAIINFAVKKRGIKDTEVAEDEATLCSEAISNVKTVQALVQEGAIFDKFMEASKKPYKRALTKGWFLSLTYSIATAFVSINFCVSYLIGMLMVNAGYCTPFQVFQVIEALNVATLMVMATASYFPEYNRAKLSAGLIFHMIEQEPKIDNLSLDGEKPNIDGKIELKKVDFAYPNGHALTLSSMSLKAKFGQTIALVGPSGCGKSTIIQLLERYYDVQNGTIQFDGINTKTINIRHLRDAIALVGQEPRLFNLSIGENIAYGLPDVNIDRIREAARLANIDTFIESLPEGYDTNIGSKGTQLSGGQKQRIAIARAVIRNPKILLLDEATAALDTESEKIVQTALDHAKTGRTCIVVAHRLSTIQNADLICVIENGKCTESGNHQQLLARKGTYAKLVDKQRV